MEKHLWGPAIWYFFHGIAEKINPDKFIEQKKNLFYIFTTVCDNLPCPECSEHAINEIKKINLHNIITKDIYKELLLEFHNRVNTRLKKSIFTREQLDEKYKNINLSAMIHNFNIAYNSNIYNEKMLQNSFKKKITNAELYKHINEVLSCCN
tara:strand:- start:629 stop:1084 length:456 start_codon:yes stop_codon:yes gene_type:complete